MAAEAAGAQAVAPAASANGRVATMPVSDAKVSGAVEIAGSEMRLSSGAGVATGARGSRLRLSSGGTVDVCAGSGVHVAAGANPGEMTLSLDQGAMELATTLAQASDVVLTPDLRIIVSGPGAVNVKVRVNQQGDTCVDNAVVAGGDAPYVTVTEQLGTGVYRVQAGQRVMLEHGSVAAVVDHEKESCGCPAAVVAPTDFPVAQSEGLAPAPVVTQPAVPAGEVHAQVTIPFVYDGGAPPIAAVPAATAPPPPAQEPAGTPDVWHAVRGFFRKIFRKN